MPEGYVVLVLHAHLPYVLSHGRWPYGTDWLCEAACECCIPLVGLIDRLAAEGKPTHFTVGVTPVLCEMLASPAFRPVLDDNVREKMRAAAADRRSFEVQGEGALVSALDANYVTIEMASTALASVNPRGAVSLPEGSWGEGGRHFLWYNKETAWMWQRLYGMEREMGRAVREAGDGATAKRLLRQMVRELFLAQSSGWQFLISTRSAGDYGEARFLGHCNAWKELYAMLGLLRASGALKDAEKRALRAIGEKDALFDDVRPEWFEERTQDGL
jgi:predicted glycosyl hydrolase (DUF1957 family)